jgi:hypothetical protein
MACLSATFSASDRTFTLTLAPLDAYFILSISSGEGLEVSIF